MSKIFVIPLRYCKILTDPPLIIKTAELAPVFEAEIDHPLGLLKVKAWKLKRNFNGRLNETWKKQQKSNRY